MLRLSEKNITSTAYGDKLSLVQILEYAKFNQLEITPGDNERPATYLTLSRIPMCQMPRIETFMFCDAWHFGSPIYKRIKTDA